jgi:hypothetical protein
MYVAAQTRRAWPSELPECELPQVSHRTHKHAIDILMRVPIRNPVPSRHCCNVGGTVLGQFERLAHLRLPFGRHVEFAFVRVRRRETVRLLRSVVRVRSGGRSGGAVRRVPVAGHTWPAADGIRGGVAVVVDKIRREPRLTAATNRGAHRRHGLRELVADHADGFIIFDVVV